MLTIIRIYTTLHNVTGAVYEYNGKRCSTFVGKNVEDVEAALKVRLGIEPQSQLDVAKAVADAVETMGDPLYRNSDVLLTARVWQRDHRVRVYVSRRDKDFGYIAVGVNGAIYNGLRRQRSAVEAALNDAGFSFSE